MSQVYQRGSLRKVSRSGGKEVWEWRYRVGGKIRRRTRLQAAQLFYCTMRVTVVEWDSAPEVAVTVMV